MKTIEPDSLSFADDHNLLKILSSKLRKDAANYTPAVLIPALFNLLSIIIFTRIFSPDDYGDYVLVVATVNIICIFFSDWILHSLMRFIPQFKKSGQLLVLYRNAFSLLLFEFITILFLAALLYVIMQKFLGRFQNYYFLGTWMLCAFLFFKVTTSIFQANLQASRYAKYHVLFSISRFFFAIGFVFLISREIRWLIAAGALSYTVFLWPIIRDILKENSFLKKRKKLDFSLKGKLSRYGFPLIGWVLATEVLMIFDKFMLAMLRNSAEVGIYGANYSLTTSGIGLIATPIIMAAHPLLLTIWESHEPQQVQKIIESFSRYLMLVLFPCLTFITVFSKQLVYIFLGEAFKEGYIILPLIFCGYSLWNFAMFGHKYLELQEKTRMMLFFVVICVGSNFVLNWILIPRYGYLGAAVSSMLSLGAYTVIVYFHSKKTPQIQWKIPWFSFLRTGFSALAMAVIMIQIKNLLHEWNNILLLLIGGTVGIVAYCVFILLFKEIKRSEISFLTKSVKDK